MNKAKEAIEIYLTRERHEFHRRDCTQREAIINGRYLSQSVTGVQRYAREIVAELEVLVRADPSLSARIIVPPGMSTNDAPASIPIVRTPIGGGPLWDQCVLPFYAQGVVLSLCNMGPLVAARHVLCIHDLNFILAPASYSRVFQAYYRVMLPWLARRAAYVVTVSAFSARMLSEYRYCPIEKIRVIPDGHEHVFRWRPQLSAYAANGAHRRPFVFVLGSRARHKNIGVLFSIAKDLDALGIDLVVAGAKGHTFAPLEEEALTGNVRQLGYVGDDDLAALYQKALCFAFPSLTEGFGLPALEALALGCPVIASNAASLPEVCGAAALSADPKSPQVWLEQIKRLQADSDLVASLKAKGPAQAARFSWVESAQKYLDLINSLAP
jgi:glycosyltransferase involved in cell wall biosynthesis